MQNTYKILLIENNIADTELIQKVLNSNKYNYQINIIFNKKEIFTIQETLIPDIIILDYKTPGIKCSEVLQILIKKHPAIPILVIGDSIGEEAAVECIKNGAMDFINKKNLHNLPEKVMKIIKGNINSSYILEFEKMFSNISIMLLKMTDKSHTLNKSLKEVSKFVNAQHSQIFLFNNDENTLSCVYEWEENSEELRKENIQNIPVLSFPWLIENLNNDKYLAYSNTKFAPSALKEELKLLSCDEAKSLIIYPVKVKDEVIGFSIFSNTIFNKNWVKQDVSVLNVFNEIFSTIYSRKKFEEELLISESRFLVALNVSPDPIVITSLKTGKIVLANQQFSKLSGYSQQNIIGKTSIEINLWHNPEDYQRFVNSLNDNGYVSNEEAEFITKDGNCKTVLLSATLITFYGETNVLTFARDITDLVKAQKSFEKSEKEYRTLVESIDEGIVMVDPDETLTFVNNAFCDMTGFERNELLGKNLQQFVLPEDSEKIIHQAKRRRKGFVDNYYLTFITKTNEKKLVKINAKPMKNGGSEYKGCLGVISDITEKTKAEKELGENKERLDLALEAANGGLIDFDIKTGNTYLSPHFYRMLGYKPNEFIASFNNLINLIHPDDSKSILDDLNDFFISRRKSYDKEFRIKAKNGEWCYILFRGDIIEFDNNKKPVRFLGVLIDITNRRSLEEKLFNAKQHIQAVLDAVPGSVSWIGSNLEYQGVNRYLANNLKVSPKDIVGKHVGFLNKESGFADFAINFINSNDIQVTKELNIDFVNGLRTNLMVAQKYKNNESAVFVGIDITEKRRAEEALQKTLRYSEKIVQTAPAIIIVLDTNGDIIQFNDFAEALTGYKRKEVAGINWFEKFVPVELRENIINIFNEVINSNQEYYKNENSLICKDNTIKLVSWYNSTLQDDKGKAIALLSIGIDITEQKQLEEQFRQAQKMEAIGQLAGGVAHDFNNLLTAIRGYSQLAMMKLDDSDPVMKAVKEISYAGDRAADLTRQLLTFSRKQVVKPMVLNPNDIIRNMQKLLSRLIGENIELNLILSKKTHNILIDPGQLEQILMNLCVNARDAIFKSGIIIIKTKNISKDDIVTWEEIEIKADTYLLISVTDNGSGIEKNNIAKIFEPFFTTKAEGKGTGLGLSTVYGIIKQNNGAINVDSEINHGTTFNVYFPVSKGKAEKIEEKNERNDAYKGDETVLIVEDTRIVRNLVNATLQMEGYKVLSASNGGSALIKCEKYEGKIDLIITDVVMPEMNGPELVERLSTIIPGTKVLYMSGYIDNPVIQKEIKKKNIEYIQKPFTPVSLLKKIRTFLDKKV